MFKKYRPYLIAIASLVLFQLLDRVFLNYFQFETNNQFVFGLFPVTTIFLIILNIILIALFIRLVRYQFALGLILAGSLSNLIDRIFVGGVVDYIRVPYIPLFNLADVSICFGTFLIILAVIIGDKFKPTTES